MPTEKAEALPPAKLAGLVDEVLKIIVARAGPADAIMVAVAVTKIIGELARMECGEEAAMKMLEEATEKARTLHVEIRCEPKAEPKADPFVIEPKDPFSIP